MIDPLALAHPNGYRLTPHARQCFAVKGISCKAVLDAANNPEVTYENGRYPGQMRHIRAGVVAVVDPARREIITAYADVVQTPLRPDQKDAS